MWSELSGATTWSCSLTITSAGQVTPFSSAARPSMTGASDSSGRSGVLS